MNDIHIILLLLSCWYNVISAYEFTELYDPSYLNLKKDDEDSWKIFADKTRCLISKVLEITMVNMGYRDVREIEKNLFKK